jgi:hypothetical protein
MGRLLPLAMGIEGFAQRPDFITLRVGGGGEWEGVEANGLVVAKIIADAHATTGVATPYLMDATVEYAINPSVIHANSNATPIDQIIRPA